MSTDVKFYEDKMQKSIEVMKKEFASIRAGRANPTVLDKLNVNYYGTPTKIAQVASVSVAEARILVIQPYDKTLLKEIEKSIQASDIGINPANDGNVIRITFPPLTEERRRELCKGVSKQGEDTKVAVRAIRRDANDKFKAAKKTSEITEDDQKALESKIQKSTDKFCEEIDKLCASKQKEIMEV